jgi:GH25 family lysozyme M1 (1,4-beta-N-acetylmuramidase)
MVNPYTDIQVQIVDVSQFQDNPGTAYKPDIDKLVLAGFLGIAVRVGYGRRIDSSFYDFWITSKGKLQRKPYWYGDYYSHKKFIQPNISDHDWGVEQGHNWFNAMKGDFGEVPGALDCEPSSIGGNINILNRYSYNVIMRAIAETYDSLTGGICEIYCSPGFIPNLYAWARTRTLWVAWYDRTKTKEQVIAECRRQGWLGPIKIWQYTSDGDINMDGVGDGIQLGMETADLDFNGYLDDLQSWSIYCGSAPSVPVEPEEPEVTEPVLNKEKIVKLVTIKSLDGLNIRDIPKDYAGSTVIGWMEPNREIELLEKKVIGANIWYRIGQGTRTKAQWCAYTYNGITFLE